MMTHTDAKFAHLDLINKICIYIYIIGNTGVFYPLPDNFLKIFEKLMRLLTNYSFHMESNRTEGFCADFIRSVSQKYDPRIFCGMYPTIG